jgi:hypothetical protein
MNNNIGILGPKRHNNGVDRFIVDDEWCIYVSFVDHDWGVTEGAVDDRNLCLAI